MSISICVWWLCGEPDISDDMFLYNKQSCANDLAVESGDMYFGRSLINRRKSRGGSGGTRCLVELLTGQRLKLRWPLLVGIGRKTLKK